MGGAYHVLCGQRDELTTSSEIDPKEREEKIERIKHLIRYTIDNRDMEDFLKKLQNLIDPEETMKWVGENLPHLVGS